MYIWLTIFAVYIAIGLMFGLVYDRREMKKDVPYEFFPAIAPLSIIRKCFFFSCAFTGVPQLCVNFYCFLRLEYLMWRVRRYLRRLP